LEQVNEWAALLALPVAVDPHPLTVLWILAIDFQAGAALAAFGAMDA
jgi:hypothetical protein